MKIEVILENGFTIERKHRRINLGVSEQKWGAWDWEGYPVENNNERHLMQVKKQQFVSKRRESLH